MVLFFLILLMYTSNELSIIRMISIPSKRNLCNLMCIHLFPARVACKENISNYSLQLSMEP
uniref:Uncharacterized protein n=1 Tax=Setaria italica TaxID=4555 RepID=K3Y4F0_SETIT